MNEFRVFHDCGLGSSLTLECFEFLGTGQTHHGLCKWVVSEVCKIQCSGKLNNDAVDLQMNYFLCLEQHRDLLEV